MRTGRALGRAVALAIHRRIVLGMILCLRRGVSALGDQSIQRAGRKPDGILLVGFDALPDEVKQIEAGKEDATVAQFPAKMGELGLAHGRRFWAMSADLGDRDAVRGLIVRLGRLGRPVDILVSNAGTIFRAPAAEHPDKAWDRVLEVNLTAPFVLARAIGADMVARGRGKIVVTALLLSFQGGVLVPGYAASKHGLAGITKALAYEWASAGVNVNAIAPGYIATDNTQALQDDPVRSHAILDRIPAGRWGRPEDVAGAAVFLASPASDYVNGTVLAVDGGWLSR
jgi:2-dehydro-3-deoxy-D-gluconate 5-dehydrogenase